MQKVLLLVMLIAIGKTNFLSDRKKVVERECVYMPFDSARYTVYKIDSLNNWYIIYGKREKNLYKIISKKEALNNCVPVRIGYSYVFDLQSALKIRGLEPHPSTLLHTGWLKIDDSTEY